jgi:hypothetical protein
MSLPFSWEAYSSQGREHKCVSILVANMPPQSLLVESGFVDDGYDAPVSPVWKKDESKSRQRLLNIASKKVHVDLSFML